MFKVPGTALGRSRRRRVVAVTGVVATVALGAALVALLYDMLAGHPGRLGLVAVAAGCLLGAALLQATYLLTSTYRPPGWARAIAAMFATGASVIFYGLAVASFEPPWVAGAAIAALSALPAYRWAFRSVSRDHHHSLSLVVKAALHATHADQMLRECEQALAGRRLNTEGRRVLEVNRAHALITRSVLANEPDGLVEAVDALHRVLVDPSGDVFVSLDAVELLVFAIAVKATKHGDASGYAEALEVLQSMAVRMPPDSDAWASVHHLTAEYRMTLAERLPPGPEAEAHADAAVNALRASISAVTRYRRPMLPVLYAKLGAYLADRRGDLADVNEGITLCRAGQRLARRSATARAWPDLGLAILLWARAGLTAAMLSDPATDPARAARIGTDLREAEMLCRRLIRGRLPAPRLPARFRLAQVLSARAALVDAAARPMAARAWQDAANHAADHSAATMTQVATNWVAWARSTQEPAWCGDAYRYLMSVVPRAAADRYLAGEKDRLLGEVDGSAEEAGYWLTRNGQPGDAAVCLELGRAVWISEVLGRERDDISTHQAGAGRPDLLARYQNAVARLGDVERGASGAQVPSAQVAQRVWAEYHNAAREVAAIEGTDRLVAPVSYDDIVAAAAGGPLIYLAAAEQRGYAVIIVHGRDPVWLPLPELTQANVRVRVEQWLTTADRHAVQVMLRWLWDNGIRELAGHLPAGSAVCLIPAGLLGLLPVHAAGGPAVPGISPSCWDFLTDRVTVRYAPNARTLLRARARAAACDHAPLSLLAVDAPHGDPRRPLASVRPEAERIVRLWRTGHGPSRRLPDATCAAVVQVLAQDSVWHFACHCDVLPDQVLDSALLLHDGRLTLRDLLRLPASTRRLAVISACKSHLSGSRLPDEAMGLPSAMLLAGLAGVVASHWVVDDAATAFLITRFYQMWQEHRLPPAEALGAAQQWLRRATRADLHAHLSGVLPLPADLSRQGWDRWAGVRPFEHPYYWAPFAITGV